MITTDEIMDLCTAYVRAKNKSLEVNAEVARLAAEGDHKKKNKVINSEGMKASLKVNQALAKLVARMDQEAEGK